MAYNIRETTIKCGFTGCPEQPTVMVDEARRQVHEGVFRDEERVYGPFCVEHAHEVKSALETARRFGA